MPEHRICGIGGAGHLDARNAEGTDDREASNNRASERLAEGRRKSMASNALKKNAGRH
jgi:hypothetical protein